MRRRTLTGAVGTLVLSGCVGGFAPAEKGDAVAAPFPECAPPYAFAGETTLAALGLGAMVGAEEANRRGEIWITRDPVDPAVFGGPAPGGGEGPPPAQLVCVEWPDGSGMAQTLQEPFTLPAGDVGADPASGGVPIAVIAVLALIGVGAIVSVIAFRSDRGAAD